MPILNYTSTVPASRTIAQIHSLLVAAGARSVMTEYDEVGRTTGMAFAVQTPYGLRSFVLPVKAASVEVVMRRDRKVPPRYKTPEQAERVAWRILKDWLEAQLALIHVEMATFDQVMLPYMQGDDGSTVYELFRDRQLALPSGSEADATA